MLGVVASCELAGAASQPFLSCYSPSVSSGGLWLLLPIPGLRQESLEEEEAELQKQLLKTQMTRWERRKLSLVCNEYLDCLIISFLRKSTSESIFFAPAARL